MDRPVVVFGAGATKDCGGPMTPEILPEAFRLFHGPDRPASFDREDFLYTVESFLVDTFRLPPNIHERKDEHYPALPLLLSLIDTAIDRNQPFGGKNPDQLRVIRRSLEYLIFVLLMEGLRKVERGNAYHRFIRNLSEVSGRPPVVITFNYDVIADSALFRDAERHGAVPDYGTEVSTNAYMQWPQRYGLLLKLHGSLNFIYCPNCHRLDLGVAKTRGGRLAPYKAFEELYREVDLTEKYSCQGVECRNPGCGSEVRPILVTPSFHKDYRNPHLSRLWHRAEDELRNATRVFIVGYSLPDDDLDVIYLLKRGLGHLEKTPDRITVVQWSKDPIAIGEHKDGQRYRALFGEGLDWSPKGFSGWLDSWDGV